jgi:hypothetical protein
MEKTVKDYDFDKSTHVEVLGIEDFMEEIADIVIVIIDDSKPLTHKVKELEELGYPLRVYLSLLVKPGILLALQKAHKLAIEFNYSKDEIKGFMLGGLGEFKS